MLRSTDYLETKSVVLEGISCIIFKPDHCGSPLGDPPRGAALGLRDCNNIVWAALNGKLGAVQHHLRTDPGAAAWTNLDRQTALHGAVKNNYGYANICRVLLAAGAPLDARDNSGLLAEDCGAGDVSVEKHWQFLPIPSASAPFKVF